LNLRPVVPENSTRRDSRDEAESAHHPMFAIIYLSFPKIPSVGIRTMRQNQRIIRADANRSTNQPQARKLFLILFNTLRRILQEYACYYNELRTHRSLNKDALIE
jgi:hypothetical protein